MNKITNERVTIRRMSRADIDAVIELDKIIGGGKSQITYKDMVSLDPGGPLDFSFVAEVGNKVVGFVLAHIMYMGMPFSEFCVIHAIDIAEKYRGQGIGHLLVHEIMDRCRDESIDIIRAIFREKDERLRNMVENMGFRRSPVVNYDFTLDV